VVVFFIIKIFKEGSLMNIKNIKVGMIIKNYKKLCELLEVKVCLSGMSKRIQNKEFERYFKCHKIEGTQKIVIDEIFTNIREKEDKRKNGNNKNKLKEYTNLKITKSEYSLIGVYKIQLNTEIYIGSTVSGFRDRFLAHLHDNKLPTQQMLKDGAEFGILWVAKNNEGEPFIRMMENKYIQFYKKQPKFHLINNNESWSLQKKKYKSRKYKIIKVDSNNYIKAKELLLINNLI
jgi:hypothetical protein